MVNLLPLRKSISGEPSSPQFIRLDESADDVIRALRSETARAILASLHEEAQTPSELAKQVDTSVQTISYHLDNLSAVGIVTIIDQWYSEKGRTMDVYAPAVDPLILFAGSEEGPIESEPEG